MPFDYSQKESLLRAPDLPQFLYKYRRWDDPNDDRNDERLKVHNKELLVNNEILFFSARHFNDPFDFRIPLRFDLAGKEYNSELYEKVLNSGDMDIKKLEAISGLNREQVLEQIEQPELCARGHAAALENRFREFGIFSMSAVPHNILMWSHYSDSHTGFCVGFDAKILDEFRMRERIEFLKRGRIVTGRIYFMKVLYCRDYPCLVPSEENHFLIPVEFFRTKAIDWSYEEEYRLILRGSTDIAKQLDEDVIAKVYMGCKMPEDSRNALIETLKARSRKVELFQAKMKQDSFGLDFEQVEY